jgi:hypothetical protein
MFFDLDTGETLPNAKQMRVYCWMADDNLWIASGIETSIQQFPTKKFRSFIVQSMLTSEYIDMSDDGLMIALESVDEGTRNLIIWNGRLFISINMEVSNLAKLSEYLKTNLA